MPKKESAPKSGAPKSKKENANIALRYSGMAFQMMAIIGVITFIGHKINNYYGIEPAYITALFAVCSIFVALYLTLKDILFPPK